MAVRELVSGGIARSGHNAAHLSGCGAPTTGVLAERGLLGGEVVAEWAKGRRYVRFAEILTCRDCDIAKSSGRT